MARGRESFDKRQREMDRQKRAAAKRERRLERSNEPTEGPAVDEDALMEEFRIVNEKHAAGELSTEEFEERRTKILAELGVE